MKSIQLGQIWRSDATGQNFLVTKLYSELFAQYAMLRPTDAPVSSDTVRIKVLKNGDHVTLPGYTYTQDAQEF